MDPSITVADNRAHPVAYAKRTVLYGFGRPFYSPVPTGEGSSGNKPAGSGIELSKTCRNPRNFSGCKGHTHTRGLFFRVVIRRARGPKWVFAASPVVRGWA
eukprot:scaffold994_cov226-Prasinococcus_capsulatus_cf.AAC.28